MNLCITAMSGSRWMNYCAVCSKYWVVSTDWLNSELSRNSNWNSEKMGAGGRIRKSLRPSLPLAPLLFSAHLLVYIPPPPLSHLYYFASPLGRGGGQLFPRMVGGRVAIFSWQNVPYSPSKAYSDMQQGEVCNKTKYWILAKKKLKIKKLCSCSSPEKGGLSFFKWQFNEILSSTVPHFFSSRKKIWKI